MEKAGRKYSGDIVYLALEPIMVRNLIALEVYALNVILDSFVSVRWFEYFFDNEPSQLRDCAAYTSTPPIIPQP